MSLSNGNKSDGLPVCVDDICVVQNGELVKQSTHHNGMAPKKRKSTPCNIGCRAWCRKFFWEGQALIGDENVTDVVTPGSQWLDQLLQKYRRPMSMLIPAVLFHFVWWSIMIRYNLWHLFTVRYPMSITMIFGSIVAGMTSEGGGAVAFPVMTLALGISPTVARDFSMMIQACGMSAAAFAIFFMRIKIEWNSVLLCSLGGALGVFLGLEFVDPLLTAPQKKMGFVSLFFAFAFALFLLNRYHKRRTYSSIMYFSLWKAVVLLVTGCIGGLLTSFVGSGLDICSFSILTLLFRVSEKIATPTSVVLMGINSMMATFWRLIMMQDVANEMLEYLAVCVPIVVLGAPLGSVIGSHFHRQVLAALVYILDTVSLISAFILVHQTGPLVGMSVGMIIGGGVFFFLLTKLGQRLMEQTEQQLQNEIMLEKTPSGTHNKAFHYDAGTDMGHMDPTITRETDGTMLTDCVDKTVKKNDCNTNEEEERNGQGTMMGGVKEKPLHLAHL